MTHKTLKERFDEKWILDADTGCWVWQAGTSKDYGIFNYDGAARGAHTFSWRYYKGDTKGLSVLHHCDNTICVNPDHLFLGTQLDNVRDCIAKGRRHAQKNPVRERVRTPRTLKLTQEIADEIRAKYSSGAFSQRQLATEYNVDQSMICRVVKNKRY